MQQDTSRAAFDRVHPKIGKAQAAVLQILRAHSEGLTNSEIAYYLQATINRVTPRVYELREMGLVIDDGKRRCRVTKSTSHAWKAKNPVLPPAFDKPEQTQQQLL